MSASVLEYLTNVLSQRGPSAVPYDEAVKWNIRDHVSELQKVFPTLTSKLSDYHTNDGRPLNVLKVEGTMPIHYQGAKYNIPILMWLAERYPVNPPQVFVVPTSNMIIRPGNFVNPSGQVSTPLLRSWLYPSSNLVDVVLEMSQVFGGEPPLYSRPAGYTPPPTAQGHMGAQPPPNYPIPHGSATTTPGPSGGGAATSNGYSAQYPGIHASTVGTMTPYATPSVGNTPNSTPGGAPGPGAAAWGSNTSGAGSAAGYASTSGAMQPPPPPPPAGFGLGNMFFGGLFGGQQPPAPPPPPPPPLSGPSSNQLSVAPPPPPQSQPPPQPPRPVVSREELEVHFRHLAIEALGAQLRAMQRSFNVYASDETEKALEVQKRLEDRRAELQTTHDALTQERMGTEQMVAELASKTKALQGWLDRNEPRAEKYDPDASSVSSQLLPVDELCRQGMETQARDLALEDAIVALDKLLQTGQVPLDAYLKQVRALCRKQFVSRAVGLKVAAAQQQQLSTAQHAPGPSGGSAAFHTAPYPIAHGDGWSHGVPPPPPPQQQPAQQQAGSLGGQAMWPPASGFPGMGLGPGPGMMPPNTGFLTNPLAGR